MKTSFIPLRSILCRPAIALATLTSLSSVATAFEPTTREPTKLVIEREPEPEIDDYTDIDDGIGPDPGVVFDPFDPADDFDTGPAPLDPADDLYTEDTGQVLWLTATNPWHATARLKATRVFEWYPTATGGFFEFKVDPTLPLDFNAKLEVDVHALPEFDYDVEFCIGWQTLTGDAMYPVLRITTPSDSFHTFSPDSTWDYTPDSECDEGTFVAGPDAGEEPEVKTVKLALSGIVPEDTVTWRVVAVRVTATPRQ